MIDVPMLDGNRHGQKMPADYDMLREWFDVIRHANSIIVRGSLQYVTITAFLDKDGKPVLWGGINCNTLFPRKRDAEFIDKL